MHLTYEQFMNDPSFTGAAAARQLAAAAFNEQWRLSNRTGVPLSPPPQFQAAGQRLLDTLAFHAAGGAAAPHVDYDKALTPIRVNATPIKKTPQQNRKKNGKKNSRRRRGGALPV